MSNTIILQESILSIVLFFEDQSRKTQLYGHNEIRWLLDQPAFQKDQIAPSIHLEPLASSYTHMGVGELLFQTLHSWTHRNLIFQKVV